MDKTKTLNQLSSTEREEITNELFYIGLDKQDITYLSNTSINQINEILQYDITEVLLSA